MNTLKKIALFFFLLPATQLQGQDIHFSQFPQSALSVNPADAGYFPADLRISGAYRRQWSSITVPYKTFSAAADAGLQAVTDILKGFGAGFQVNHDEAGDGELSTLDLRLFLSFRKPLGADSVHFIRAGFMTGFSQRIIDFSKLSFDAQYNGDLYDPLAPTGEKFNSNSASWLDIGFGLGWDMIREKSIWQAGLSAIHVNTPDQGFYSEAVRRPVLWQVNTGIQLLLNESFTLMPSLLFMRQHEFREFNGGAELKMNIPSDKRSSASVGFTLYHRWEDAIIPGVVLYLGKFRLGFSYDINTSPLKSVSRSRGGPELSIVYLSKKIKASAQRSIICPVY